MYVLTWMIPSKYAIFVEIPLEKKLMCIPLQYKISFIETFFSKLQLCALWFIVLYIWILYL